MKGVNSLATSMVDADLHTQVHLPRRVDIAELKSIQLFAEMADYDLVEVAAAGSERRFAPGALFIREGGQCHALHLIMEGTVEMFSGSDDQEVVIDIVQPGAVLLLTSVMAGLPYAASASTLSPARIVAISAAAIHELFERDRKFARTVVGELSRASHRMLAELSSFKTRTSTERLLNWLLSVAQSKGSGHFKLPFGKRTLASLLGMTPECLSRSLRGLGKHGITVRGRDVSFADQSAWARAVSALRRHG